MLSSFLGAGLRGRVVQLGPLTQSCDRYLRITFRGFVSPIGSCHRLRRLRLAASSDAGRRPGAARLTAVDASLPAAVANFEDWLLRARLGPPPPWEAGAAPELAMVDDATFDRY